MTTAPTRARAWTLLVGGELVYRVLAGVFWLVLARALGQASLGDVALATALSLPALAVLDGGLAQYLIRESDPAGRLPRAIRAPLRRRSVLLVVMPLAIAGLTQALGTTSQRALIGLLVGASISFEGAAQAWLTGPRARGDMRPDAQFRALYGVVSVAIVAAVWATGDLTGVMAAAATATGAAVAAAICFRHLPSGPRFVEREVADPADRRRFVQTTIATSAFLATDVILVGALLGSTKLAPYALAAKVVATMAVLPIALSRVSLSWAARGEQDTAAEVRVAARLGLAMTLAGVAAGPLTARVLFGAHYAHAMLDPLRLLALTMFFVSIKAPLLGRHLGAGDTALVARSASIALVTALVLVPLGVFAVGTAGAAAGVLLAEAAGTAVYVPRRREDGWAGRDLLPGPLATGLAIAATVAALAVPPFSVAVVPLAALAGLAAFSSLKLSERIGSRRPT